MATSIRLVRHFSLASLVAVLIVAFALASFMPFKAETALVEQGEFKNATQVRLILNQLDSSERATLEELLALKAETCARRASAQAHAGNVPEQRKRHVAHQAQALHAGGLTVFSSETAPDRRGQGDLSRFSSRRCVAPPQRSYPSVKRSNPSLEPCARSRSSARTCRCATKAAA